MHEYLVKWSLSKENHGKNLIKAQTSTEALCQTIQFISDKFVDGLKVPSCKLHCKRV